MFRKIFHDESLYFPIQWDGDDFYVSLERLFSKYIENIEMYYSFANLPIKRICSLIKKSVKHYLDGFPSKTYNSFVILMDLLLQRPLRGYLGMYNDGLDLFRVAKIDDNIPYAKTRIFHPPYNLRSKVSTSRYSIAGYLSLYLGTSLELCCEEVQYNPHKGFAMASRFKAERSIDYEYNDTEISVIELSVKPQDFFDEENNAGSNRRIFDGIALRNNTTSTR